MVTGVVGIFCKIKGRRFVFRTASDTDCVPGQQLIRFWRDRKIYEFGLRNADVIAVQSVKQQDLLSNRYKLGSTPVNMAVEIPSAGTGQQKDIDVLWVNNMRHLKRPELILEIARKLPKRRFVMIGGPLPGLNEYYNEVTLSADKVQNLDFKGFVPYAEIGSYFERSKVFVNTSEIEGFPNSFLQAWVRGVPTISFFDPDNLITYQGLGAAVATQQEMFDAVEHFLTDDNHRETAGKKAREYVMNNYSPLSVARKYDHLISS